MRPEDRAKLGFGIYIHWPFCQAKCPYCDFNSHVTASIDESRWKSAYFAELRRSHEETPNSIVTSVFFGGGTPSLMSPNLVSEIISEIRLLWRTSNDLEISLEANPTSSEAGKFHGFAQAGINRLSMGIQALNNSDLQKLGRLHSVEEAKTAFDHARAAFERVSFDLIYARQDQTLEDWKRELKEATEMAVDHLSLYQLTIEPGTAFGARHTVGKLTGLPSEDISAEMYDATQEITEAAGLAQYETSNHARPNAQSRHNLIYWRGGDYVGIGPGAHGRLTNSKGRYATYGEATPGKWLKLVETRGSAETERDQLSRNEQLEEYVLMSLRLVEGMDRSILTKLDPSDQFYTNLDTLIDREVLVRTDERIVVKPEYRILLNAVLREILV